MPPYLISSEQLAQLMDGMREGLRSPELLKFVRWLENNRICARLRRLVVPQ